MSESRISIFYSQAKSNTRRIGCIKIYRRPFFCRNGCRTGGGTEGAIDLNEQFRLSDLQTKDVINVRDGKNFGRICDMELDAQSGNIVRLVLPGRPRFFGLLGRDEDRDILWDQIKLIGIDTILVDVPVFLDTSERKNPWAKY